MDIQTLKANVRSDSGKGKARALRRDEQFPGVLYGGEGEPIGLAINARDFIKFLNAAGGEHSVVQLEADNGAASGPALLKEVQRHPVRGTVMHADFQRIDLSKPIDTVVAIDLVGRAIGVIAGGILDHQLRYLDVRCLPTAVPEKIVVDVTGLELGQGLHVSDLEAPDGVEITTPEHYAVAAVLASRLTRTTKGGAAGEDAEAEGEGEEGGEEEESD